MENFIVSARKYRPQTFDTVVGQGHITSTLKNAIKTNHVAQAYLFCGPRGVGKTTCARILAKTINCFNRTKNIEACNECDSCKSFNSGNSLNIFELDGASNNSVEDIRNLISQVSFAPQIGSHKVYIIDEVHMLSQAAFNAFLKTLEEPPHHAIFILATTEKHKIIPTILSRCQVFDFNRIRIEDIVSHLAEIAKKENVEVEEDALHIIAQKSDGAMRDALSIFDQMIALSENSITYKTVIDNLSILDYDYYFKVTDALIEKNASASLLLLNEILSKGFDGHLFINGLAGHLRNLLVCKDESTLQLLEVSAGVRKRYKTQSKKTDVSFLLKGLNILNNADVQYKSSRNPRLLVELTLLQLCSAGTMDEKKNDIIPLPAIKEETTLTTTPAPTMSYLQPSTQPSVALETPIQKIFSSEKQKETRVKPTIGKITSKLTISGMTNGSDLLKTAPTKPNEDEKETNTPPLELHTAWNNFVEELKKKNKFNLSVTLKSGKLEKEDDTTITFHVLNQVQEDEINTVKTDLLSYLRSSLKIPTLKLKIIVDDTKTERKPFTEEEKFQRLAEKNSLLNKLRQQFGLEIEY
jgi:DNA polymerase-3 subunit gamma/tau